MLDQPCYGAAATPASRRAATAAPGTPRAAAVAEAALLAELALTFDLEALVAEAQADPFRR